MLISHSSALKILSFSKKKLSLNSLISFSYMLTFYFSLQIAITSKIKYREMHNV